MLAAISKGNTLINNLLMGDDILRTMDAFRAMGVSVTKKNASNFIVKGVGIRGLKKPSRSLYLGNSGTTMRILPGILAGQDFEVTLKGDKSLSARPMSRIVRPLRGMGTKISGKNILARSNNIKICPPLKIKGGTLKAIQYRSKIASAQVKSCILLAGLFAEGVTSVTEPVKSRDHTERMLKIFSSRLKTQGLMVSLKGPVDLKSPGKITIPADISSAAFFIVAGIILPGTKIILKKVGLNPTRTGVIDILKKMGADIKIGKRSGKFEPQGDIVVRSGKLRGVVITSKEVARAIDEIPIIMTAACFAKGITKIHGIGELRVKETDRVKSMVTNLRKIGADIRLEKESIVIHGGASLHGATVSSFGDHRTAMSMLIAGLAVKGNIKVTGLECINKSFPGFQGLLKKSFYST
ncbi:MAG: 3-phosphoshikimate 1-carboxyvinyltransferase [Candidatus Omnitrophica bacterium]|nr:3-phosphoshikimate 1-carboxyvinyltransferase [Candidatus Omnitrophota bacterium]